MMTPSDSITEYTLRIRKHDLAMLSGVMSTLEWQTQQACLKLKDINKETMELLRQRGKGTNFFLEMMDKNLKIRADQVSKMSIDSDRQFFRTCIAAIDSHCRNLKKKLAEISFTDADREVYFKARTDESAKTIHYYREQKERECEDIINKAMTHRHMVLLAL